MPKITVIMLATDMSGFNQLVKGLVKQLNTDGDFSVEIHNAEIKLRSLGYTVHGSFLETCPAARLVDLDKCVLVFK